MENSFRGSASLPHFDFHLKFEVTASDITILGLIVICSLIICYVFVRLVFRKFSLRRRLVSCHDLESGSLKLRSLEFKDSNSYNPENPSPDLEEIRGFLGELKDSNSYTENLFPELEIRRSLGEREDSNPYSRLPESVALVPLEGTFSRPHQRLRKIYIPNMSTDVISRDVRTLPRTLPRTLSPVSVMSPRRCGNPVTLAVKCFLAGDVKLGTQALNQLVPVSASHNISRADSLYLDRDCIFRGLSALSSSLSKEEKTLLLPVLAEACYRRTGSEKEAQKVTKYLDVATRLYEKANSCRDLWEVEELKKQCQKRIAKLKRSGNELFMSLLQQALLLDAQGQLISKEFELKKVSLGREEVLQKLDYHTQAFRIRDKIKKECKMDMIELSIFRQHSCKSDQRRGYSWSLLSKHNPHCAETAKKIHQQSMEEQASLLDSFEIESKRSVATMIAAQFDKMLRELRILQHNKEKKHIMIDLLNRERNLIQDAFDSMHFFCKDKNVVDLHQKMMSSIDRLIKEVEREEINIFSLNNPYIPE